MTKTCLRCGKDFSVQPHRYPAAKYCSVRCYNQARRDRRFSVTCKHCGKGFTVKAPSEAVRRKYCSRVCSQKAGGINARVDLTGQVFGRLTVVSEVERNHRHTSRWLCRCECGNTPTVSMNNLKSGATVSCGCYNREQTSLPEGEGAFNSLLATMKYNAKRRGYEWRLTKGDVRYLTQQPCYYCGAPPAQGHHTAADHNGVYIYNGVDRVDNSRGYTPGNVVACCGVCNSAKRTMGIADFLAWVERIYKHRVVKGTLHGSTTEAV